MTAIITEDSFQEIEGDANYFVSYEDFISLSNDKDRRIELLSELQLTSAVIGSLGINKDGVFTEPDYEIEGEKAKLDDLYFYDKL